jgi:hypothetical protein
MQTQSGYNCRNDPRLMFGLRDAAEADSVVVHWPSGLVETHRNVAADAVVVLTEGETSTSAPNVRAPRTGFLRAAPNPAFGRTTVRWESPAAAGPLRVRDVGGRVVRTVAGTTAAVGTAVWDGRTDAGATVPAGVYFVSRETPAGIVTTRVTLLR